MSEDPKGRRVPLRYIAVAIVAVPVLALGAGYVGYRIGNSPAAPPPVAQAPTATATHEPPAPAPRTLTPAADGKPTFPDAKSTGVEPGRALKAVEGEYLVTTAGMVVEDLDIKGSMTIDAPNVTVRNVRVTCSNSHWIIKANSAYHVTITDSTLTVDRSRPENYCQYGIQASDEATIERNDISFTPDGLTFTGTSATVTANWIHDQVAYPGRQDHVDAAQINGGSPGPFIFRGNHFSVPEGQTGCLALFADFGPVRNVLADGNLFDGAGYSVYGGTATAQGIRFVNNWFGRSFSPNGGRFGPVAYYSAAGAGNEWQNNRWLDTGDAVLP